MTSRKPGKGGDREKSSSSSAPGPDSGEATESAAKAYEQTERPGSTLHPTSGDRNTAAGQDLPQS